MKIVVIDDEPDLINIMRFNLEEMNHEVKCFTDLDLAQDYIKDNQIDYLIIDFFMPKMNGLQFLNTLYQSNIKIPKVLFYSGNLDLNLTPQDSEKFQIMRIFEKPLGLEDLFSYINND